MYPEPSDPKTSILVMCKYGLSRNMELIRCDRRNDTTPTWSVNIVKGMTKEQFKDRLASPTLDEARPYLKLCYTQDSEGQLGVKAHKKEVVFLRDDAWMVILHNGRAVDLVLCKGY